MAFKIDYNYLIFSYLQALKKLLQGYHKFTFTSKRLKMRKICCSGPRRNRPKEESLNPTTRTKYKREEKATEKEGNRIFVGVMLHMKYSPLDFVPKPRALRGQGA